MQRRGRAADRGGHPRIGKRQVSIKIERMWQGERRGRLRVGEERKRRREERGEKKKEKSGEICGLASCSLGIYPFWVGRRYLHSTFCLYVLCTCAQDLLVDVVNIVSPVFLDCFYYWLLTLGFLVPHLHTTLMPPLHGASLPVGIYPCIIHRLRLRTLDPPDILVQHFVLHAF